MTRRPPPGDASDPDARPRTPGVSIIIPARNEEDNLPAALDAALAQDYAGSVEIIVADGSDTAATAEMLRRRYPTVRRVSNPARTIPAGLNRALREATGEIVVRCDARTVLSPGHVRRAVATLVRTGAASVGGRQNVVGATLAGRAFALAARTVLGSGSSRYRMGKNEGPTDSVYLGAWFRTKLNAMGRFNPSLLKNQDYELNWRLRRRGDVVWFDPGLSAEYRPRATLRALARQYFDYGWWKAVMLLTHPASMKTRQVAAPLLVLGLAVSGALALAGATGAAMLPIGYLALLAAGFLESLRRRRDPLATPLVPVVLATMHLAWGVGFLSSMVRNLRPRRTGKPRSLPRDARSPGEPAGREAEASGDDFRVKFRILILSSTYVPDPSSTGQHFHDVAAALAGRDHRVSVVTANRGYDDPTRKYPSWEMRDGVVIRRIPLSSLGKYSLLARAAGWLSFVAQAAGRGLLSPRPDVVLVSTAPPIGAAAALVLSRLRRVPILYWIHDLHPNLAIALGVLKDDSLWARLLDRLNHGILGHAARIVCLDRFMAAQVSRKADVTPKSTILPPWPHNDDSEWIDHADNPWRRKHVEDGRRIVMYSGNHSPAHPLDTLLQAALELQDEDGLAFLFVGGGTGKRQIEAVIEREGPRNIRSLPYQPLETLRYSLAAADVHVVSVGDQTVGTSHPCKIYGALAAGRPVLLFSPRVCHATDIIGPHDVGWRVSHGDVRGAVEALRSIRRTPPERLEKMGRTAQELVRRRYSRDALCHRFRDEVEALLPSRPAPREQER